MKRRRKTGVGTSEAVVFSSYCDKLWDELLCYDGRGKVIQQKLKNNVKGESRVAGREGEGEREGERD